MSQKMKHTYAAAGVDINLASQVKKVIARQAQTTYGAEVLSGVGFFGGMYEFKGYKNPVLVSHVDGVGTKLRIALAMEKHDTIGMDIVNHCVNDIFTCGAKPLFFLDYIAMGKLTPQRVEAIVQGLVSACKEAGCALISGETAEMPGIYAGDDYDLVGFINGVVEKDKIIMGKAITAGDTLIGLPSSGLHTNGYSLVRKIFGETRETLGAYSADLGMSIGAALLEPHRCYYNQLNSHLPVIKGLAHITGGAFFKNIPRILPEGFAARIDTKAWTVPPLFQLIQKQGAIDKTEMYRVFNMGIGMAIACAQQNADKLLKALPEAVVIGGVVKQAGEPRLILE